MNLDITTRLDEATRAEVTRIMDVLLPGTDTLPSASAVDAQGELLDMVLRADPTLEPLVRLAGERAAGVELSFDVIESWFGEDAERLVFALHAAYYMSTQVREKLSYPGQVRAPVSLATPDQLCSEELIAPVEARGPIFVPTPTEA
ncbi:hypothetical protein JOF28_001937 [Leucobacter exalbidus]|uniref:Uncharacterized protein n=1 Tax=Leucobacter exalbidus TaxID=662960 RepID=A0A940PUY8_9MICO|nr:hypothetical protein [Leucobacter exalbidus]MBP1326705.1 hypothetical protein [Leucobacter exalbidus]